MIIRFSFMAIAHSQYTRVPAERHIAQSIADMRACEAEMTEATCLTPEDLTYRFNS